MPKSIIIKGFDTVIYKLKMNFKALITILLFFQLINCTTGFSQSNSKVTVVAASDMKFALDSVVSSFCSKNKTAKIKVIYGSSGKLYEQIMNSAPFDIFFSADIDFPKKLKANGKAISEVKSYGVGRIVLWSKTIDPNVAKMNSLTLTKIKKIAIANPAHAPYGARAKESIEKNKLLDKVQSKLVYGENISQTAQYVTSGAADIGIIALSLAISPAMNKEGGKYYLIPEESHTPLDQGYVLLKNAKDNSLAKQFYDFIATPTAKKILAFYGFKQK